MVAYAFGHDLTGFDKVIKVQLYKLIVLVHQRHHFELGCFILKWGSITFVRMNRSADTFMRTQNTIAYRSIEKTAESLYANEFDRIVSLFPLEDKKLHLTYDLVLDRIFTTNVSWGGLIAANIFTNKLRKRAKANGLHHLDYQLL